MASESNSEDGRGTGGEWVSHLIGSEEKGKGAEEQPGELEDRKARVSA